MKYVMQFKYEYITAFLITYLYIILVHMKIVNSAFLIIYLYIILVHKKIVNSVLLDIYIYICNIDYVHIHALYW